MDQAGQLSGITDPKFRALCETVVSEMERLHVPGVAVGAYDEGQEQIAGFGVTNIDHPLPVNADTLFQIGSITKTFVGTLAMRLVEAGKLELDAPLRRYLPDLRMSEESVAANLTMRHLLTHTGGWVGDYFDDMGYGDDALANMVEKVAELPQLTPLGEIWSYNNSGFYLAGRVIEVLTGKPFEAAMQEWILDPLGMKMSFFHARDVITRRFAVGHQIENDQASVATPWSIGRAAHPAGGLACTVGDLFRYARFHMGDGTTAEGVRLLTPESLALMRTPQCAAGGINHVGLTWFITDIDGVHAIGHGGGTNGQITQLTLVPERGFALAVLTNAGRGGQITGMAVKEALKTYLGLEMPEATPIATPAEQLEPFVGRYESRMTRLDLTLSDGDMVLQATPKGGFPRPDTPPPPPPPPVKIALYAEDRAVGLEPPYKDARIEFLRDPDGAVVWMRVGGRVHRREAPAAAGS
jgi:CubicO group peptidase (beta-lactamase class C family)